MIDLHMHSNYSDDGTYSPEELLAMCENQGITGIELDCVYEGVNFHLLGYGIDADSPDFLNIEENIEAQRKEISLLMLEKTKNLGFAVTPEELYEKSKDSYWPNAVRGDNPGSDFHGKTKPAISLGQHHGAHRQEEIIRQILQKLQL